MLRKRKIKVDYTEYYVNDSLLRKLYSLYIKQSVLNPLLDALVFVAILITAIGFTANLFIEINTPFFILINVLSGFIIFVFVIELMKKYAEAPNKRYFFKKHWIDFILVTFLSFYTIFIGFLGIIKLFIFDLLKPIFKELKDYRVMYKLFKRE